MTLLLALFACQEPFGTDRHDLVGFRIAALRAEISGDEVRPRAAMVVEGRPWSDAPVALRWYWPDDPRDLEEPVPAPAAEGPAPVLERGGDLLGLVATAPDGQVRRAVLELGTRIDLDGIELSVVDGSRASDVVDVSAEARAAWTATPADFVPVDGIARLQARATGEPLLRWMTVGGAGTVLELDLARADWATGDLEVDDGEVVGRALLDPGPVTLLALAVDGTGGTDVRATELWVGAPAPGVWVAGRWMAADEALKGPIHARLVADDDAPTGLRLEDVAPADAGASPDPLPCSAGVDGPFDPAWLLDQRCLRSQVAGAVVLLEAE